MPRDIPMVGESLHLMEVLDNSPITASTIRKWTELDPILSKVKTMVLQGWPSSVEGELQAYYQRRNELSVEDQCLLWGNRVVILARGQKAVAQLLHDGHPGMTRMKSLARSVVWWPGIDDQIEESVKVCTSCQEKATSPPAAPIHPWEWPTEPWKRIHIDYAGPFLGKMFLLVIDAHSKWIEVVPVPSATAANTIQQLRSMFARYGLPQLIVSDNGTQFTSAEFHEFTKRNGIQHLTIAPYHPSSNGLAERAVQTFKQAMKKASDSTDVETNLARFLFHYRSTPTTTTGVSPAELFLKRSMRKHLQLMRPNMEMRVKLKQQTMTHQQRRNLLTSQLVIWCICVIGPQDQDGFLEKLLMSKDLPISTYKLKTGVFFIDILIKCEEDSYLQLEPQMIVYPVLFQEMM